MLEQKTKMNAHLNNTPVVFKGVQLVEKQTFKGVQMDLSVYDGKSAYELAVINGFEGTEEEWLASLVGAKGDKGDTGLTGPQGAQGVPGRDGKDGAIKFEELTPDEIEQLKGPRGDVGPQGATGPQGEKGDRGDRGLPGIDGAVGPQGPRGFQGERGFKGDQGPQGIQGLIGPKGDKGEKGDAFTYSDFTPSQLEGLVGPQGPQGPRGDVGSRGEQGLQGIQGIQGPKGDQGNRGEQGIQGPKGDIGLTGLKGDKGDVGPQGIQGPIGLTGAKGSTGAQGAKGDNGFTWKPTVTSDGTLTWAANSSTVIPEQTNIKGPKGDLGVSLVYRGAFDSTRTYFPPDFVTYNGSSWFLDPANGGVSPGALPPGQNYKWIPLAKAGAIGPQGPEGPRGADGTVSFDNLTPEQVLSLKGDRGETGATGLKGDKGDRGEQGARGYDARLNHRGQWDPEASYSFYDSVYHKGSSYVYVNSGLTNPEPRPELAGTSRSFSTYASRVVEYPWRIIALAGANGEKGVDGITPVKGVDYFTQAEIDDIISQASGGAFETDWGTLPYTASGVKARYLYFYASGGYNVLNPDYYQSDGSIRIQEITIRDSKGAKVPVSSVTRMSSNGSYYDSPVIIDNNTSTYESCYTKGGLDFLRVDLGSAKEIAEIRLYVGYNSDYGALLHLHDFGIKTSENNVDWNSFYYESGKTVMDYANYNKFENKIIVPGSSSKIEVSMLRTRHKNGVEQYIGVEGQLIADMSDKTVYLMDGTTVGGFKIAEPAAEIVAPVTLMNGVAFSSSVGSQNVILKSGTVYLNLALTRNSTISANTTLAKIPLEFAPNKTIGFPSAYRSGTSVYPIGLEIMPDGTIMNTTSIGNAPNIYISVVIAYRKEN